MSHDDARTDLLRAEELQAEVRELDLERFGHAEAWDLGQRVVALATERDLGVTVAIWLGEQRVFQAARPGTSADNDSWMDRKCAVVRRYDDPSMAVMLRWRGHGVTQAEPRLGLDPAVHALAGGGVPIRVRGALVGVAVVSGLTDEEDHVLMVEALTAHRDAHRG